MSANYTHVAPGQRYGSLVVVEQAGRRMDTARKDIVWLCRCDCGNTIKLTRPQLRGSEGGGRGRGLVDSCNTCGQKICVVCGVRFSRKRKASYCESPACIDYILKKRNQHGRERLKQRYAESPELLEARRAKGRERSRQVNAADPGRTWAWFLSLSPERQEKIREAGRKRSAEKYERDKIRARSDPEFDAHRKAVRRKAAQNYYRRKALADFAPQIEKIVEKLQNDEQ